MKIGISVNSTIAVTLAMERARKKEAASLADDILRGVVKRNPERSGAAKRAWTKTKLQDDNYRISNQKPYIGVLDKGSSSQAPQGMVGPTLKSLNLKGN